MKRLFIFIFTALFMSLVLATCIYAEVPHLIRFQGKVTDKAGAPLNGAYNITFRIYDAQDGGSLLWSETQASVPVNNGIFTTLLGNVNALALGFDAPYWLSMEVNDDGEMAPRQAITSVGYAIHAEVADSIANVSVIPRGAIILWTGASCPQGYTRLTALDSKFIVGGAAYNPTAGGSNTHNHGGTVGAGTHNHSYSGTTNMSDFPSGAASGGDGFVRWQHTHTYSGTTNTDGSHTHTVPDADNRPEFATVLFCQKD